MTMQNISNVLNIITCLTQIKCDLSVYMGNFENVITVFTINNQTHDLNMLSPNFEHVHLVRMALQNTIRATLSQPIYAECIISHPSQLDKSIPNFKVVGWCFLFLFRF